MQILLVSLIAFFLALPVMAQNHPHHQPHDHHHPVPPQPIPGLPPPPPPPPPLWPSVDLKQFPYAYLRCSATSWGLDFGSQFQGQLGDETYLRINLKPGQVVDNCSLVLTKQPGQYQAGYVTARPFAPNNTIVAGTPRARLQFARWPNANFIIRFPKPGSYLVCFNKRFATIELLLDAAY